jgi:hypothetical protein
MFIWTDAASPSQLTEHLRSWSVHVLYIHIYIFASIYSVHRIILNREMCDDATTAIAILLFVGAFVVARAERGEAGLEFSETEGQIMLHYVNVMLHYVNVMLHYVMSCCGKTVRNFSGHLAHSVLPRIRMMMTDYGRW